MNKLILLILIFIFNTNISNSSSLLQSCYETAKKEATSCVMMYWGNAAGQTACNDWKRNHQMRCYQMYKNPKPITQKIANCLKEAHEQKIRCNLLNYRNPLGLQNCTRAKFRAEDTCYYINQ